jgi:hypothetical protein
MHAEKLIAENPLTKDLLKEWFLNKLMESVEDFDKDDAFKEFMIKSGITDDQIITVFKEGGRAALDMFDEKDVIINIKHNWKTKKFSYYINDEKESGSYSTRKEAEASALSQAVTMLEEKLTEQLTENEEENENQGN